MRPECTGVLTVTLTTGRPFLSLRSTIDKINGKVLLSCPEDTTLYDTTMFLIGT